VRIGIDARLVYYHQAGIGQYILRLTQALAASDHTNDFIIFKSRKDSTSIVNQSNFRTERLWTPSHQRFERPPSCPSFHSMFCTAPILFRRNTRAFPPSSPCTTWLFFFIPGSSLTKARDTMGRSISPRNKPSTLSPYRKAPNAIQCDYSACLNRKLP
jgi:hypothetical protein